MGYLVPRNSKAYNPSLSEKGTLVHKANMKRIGILTGGGDAPGLNAVIRAVVKTANNIFDCEVVGRHTYGDHNIYIGQVGAAEVLGEGEPMLTTEGMRYTKK